METKQSDMMGPARYPNTYYYGIQPTISRVAAEMDDMSVAYPTQGMLDGMADRAYDEINQMYPGQMGSQSVDSSLHTDQPFFGGRRIARDLLTILLLQELFRRRRYYY